MNDPRFAVPPSTRPILPSRWRRVAFWILGVAAAILRVLTLPHRWRSGWHAASRHRILVLEPYGMGDVLALQPLVRAWCAAGREVVVGTRAAWHSLLVPHPNLTCMEVSPPWVSPSNRGIGRMKGFFACARQLRMFASGARGVDVRGDVRSILLLYAAGCGRVETLTHYFTANDCCVFPLAARRHPVDRTVERWRLNAVFAAAEGLVLTPPSLEHLRETAPGVVSDPLRVGVVPLTPWAGKRWLPEAWRQVVEGVRARGFKPVLLCGPGEREAAVAAAGLDRSSDTPFADLVPPAAGVACGGVLPAAGRISPSEPQGCSKLAEECADVPAWVAQLERCEAVLCVNTGPLHLAAALGIPLVVIEGTSRLPLWAPASSSARVVHHQDVAGCAPCHQVGDPADCARRCMALVQPDEILEALDEILLAIS